MVDSKHAGVLPSFVLDKLGTALITDTASFVCEDLLCWPADNPIDVELATQIRQKALLKIRQIANEVWPLKCGIALRPGWHRGASDHDLELIERIDLHDGSGLEHMTLREIKAQMKVPLERVLGCLARLEAAFWTPEDLDERQRLLRERKEMARAKMAASIKNSHQVCDGNDGNAQSVEDDDASSWDLESPYRLIDVTPDAVSTIEKALAIPWIDQVTPDDIRFSFEGESLRQWLQERLSRKEIAQGDLQLTERIVQADALSADQEIRELVQYAASGALPKKNWPNWARMFLDRWLSREGKCRTLQEAADIHGVTREWIRNVCATLEQHLCTAQAVTPAIDKVISQAQRLSPMSADEFDARCRDLMGEDSGIENLLEFSTLLCAKQPAPIRVEKVRRLLKGEMVLISMIVGTETQPWVRHLLGHVARDSNMYGCTNVLRMAGNLALNEQLAPGLDAIVSVLESTPGFRWLDKELGWFSVGDGEGSALSKRVRKLMAVAWDSIGADEIAAALASDDMMIYRDRGTLGLATPPVHVIRELLMGWSWLRVHQKGRFLPSEPFDPTDALTDVEAAIVEVITANGGAATRLEMKKVVVEKMGLTEVLLSMVLGSSPIINKVEHGIYALRGRRIHDDTLPRLRKAARENKRPKWMGEASESGFTFRITEASLRHEQYNLPSIHVQQFSGKTVALLDEEGWCIGEARVNRSGAMTGLNAAFSQPTPGDRYSLSVHEDGLVVRYQRAHELRAQQQSQDAEKTPEDRQEE